ncbi:MAG TPA: ABC transporter permease [Gemmatimonadales bacterium]
MMDALLQDLRYAFRSLRRQPGFAAVVVLTLGIGIGANTTIFSVVNGVLIRPLPYREPDQLVMLWTMLPNFGREVSSLPDFRDWRDQNTSFTDVAASVTATAAVMGEGEPERVRVGNVTANFFHTLGVSAALGRGFTPDEEIPNSRVVIVSHGFWRQRLGGRSNVVGETLRLSGLPHTIVGIAPPGFRFGTDVQLWVPLNTADQNAGRRNDFLTIVARKKPGVTTERAQAEISGIMRHLGEEYQNTNLGVDAQVISLHEQVVGDIRPALLVFMGAVGLVLLIACANVASLMLARAAAREREMAVRAALGAGRGRLILQTLTESVVLSLGGATLGLVLAVWGVAALRHAQPGNLPRVETIAVDGRVLAFTLLLALAVAVLFGLAPALRLAATDLSDRLRDGARAVTGGTGLRETRGMLVLAEVALAVLLLAGAGLLIRSFDKLQRVDVGVRPEEVLTAALAPPAVKYAEMPEVTEFHARLLEELPRAPGVRDAALVNNPPVSGGAGYNAFVVEGRPVLAPGASVPDAQRYVATPEFFRVLSIPLIRGRFFTAQDREGAVGVAIINETMARKHFTGEDPLGRRLSMNGRDWYTIVGIVGDTRQEGVVDEPYAQMYFPYAQLPQRAVYVVLRTAGDPLAAVGSLRQTVKSLDPEIPLYNIAAAQQLIDRSIARPRVNAALLSVFAAVALVLAAIGIYGVLSYAVAQRTREIGVRMALGAHARDVVRLIVRQGMLPVVAGLGVGLVTALAATRLMGKLLYGVGPDDPVTFVVIAGVLTAVALVAALLPARRATRVDPMVALRTE